MGGAHNIPLMVKAIQPARYDVIYPAWDNISPYKWHGTPRASRRADTCARSVYLRFDFRDGFLALVVVVGPGQPGDGLNETYQPGISRVFLERMSGKSWNFVRRRRRGSIRSVTDCLFGFIRVTCVLGIGTAFLVASGID